MGRKQYRTSKPRVTKHPDGRATLSGLELADLHQLIVMASLHNYDSLDEYEKELEDAKREAAENPEEYLSPIKVANAEDNLACVKRYHRIIKQIKAAVDRVRLQRPEPVLTLKQQLLENKQEREMFQRIFDAAVSGKGWLDQLIEEVDNQEKASCPPPS